MLKLVQKRKNGVVEPGAFVGQRHRAAGAIEESHFEVLFEALDGPTDPGLSQPERLSRTDERSGGDNCIAYA